MTPIKTYLYNLLIGKKLHFKCDCIFPLDFVGVVKDIKRKGEHIMLVVDNSNKLIEIELDHPKLSVEEV